MEKVKVTKTFSPKKFRDNKLALKAGAVLNGMTGNPHFPGIEEKLVALRTKLTQYETALSNSLEGGRYNTVIKNYARRELENALGELANYVQIASNGDAAAIAGSGFDIHRKKVRVGPLGIPMYFAVAPGLNTGSIMLSCRAIPHATMYLFEYTLTPVTADSIWIQMVSTRRKGVIEGLQSGRQYAFRVAGAGSNPYRVWCDEILSYVI